MRNKEMLKNYKPERNIAKAGPIKHNPSTETNDQVGFVRRICNLRPEVWP